MDDPVNHPSHYCNHPSGVECIDITEHMSFNLGNAMKYIWRADLKGNALQDLEKAEFYIKREINKLKKDKTDGLEQKSRTEQGKNHDRQEQDQQPSI